MPSDRESRDLEAVKLATRGVFALVLLGVVLVGLFTGELTYARGRSVKAQDDAAFFVLAMLVMSALGLGAGVMAWRVFEERRRG